MTPRPFHYKTSSIMKMDCGHEGYVCYIQKDGSRICEKCEDKRKLKNEDRGTDKT